MNYEQSLRHLAELNGIEPFHQACGAWETASVDSMCRSLEILGVSARTEAQVQRNLRLCSERPWRQLVEPVTVIWLEKKPALQLRVPNSLARGEIECELRLENGSCRTWSFCPDQNPALQEAKIGRSSYTLFEAALPDLPIGCHTLALRSKTRLWRTMLIVAPTRSYSDPELVGSWGLLLPVYAAHSETSWGAGNLGDYSRLSRWVGSQGGAFVGSVPILAAFLEDWCCEPSPYAPASRLFWNEFLIDISAVPELDRNREARHQMRSIPFTEDLRKFRESPLIDYADEMRARRSILTLLAASFFEQSGPRRESFEAFVRERPELQDYARFRAMCEQTGQGWPSWEQRMRDGDLTGADETLARYHMHVQWLAQEQVDQVTRDEDAAEFYLDLPLGVHPNSYDMWRERESFAMEATVGAPPDQFISKGQNWGFAPPHPVKSRQHWYLYLRRVLQFHMKHTGLLRIDHVMSLRRLFWIPKGGSPTDGVYVRYPTEELCALLSLESHRSKTMIVGENLGTVPPEVNELMRRHEFRGLHVFQFSLRPGSKPLASPEGRVLASLGTHDTATIAGFLRGSDISDRLDLGLITADQAEGERRRRARTVKRVEDHLRRCGWLAEGECSTLDCVHACLRFLAQSQAEMVAIDLEDLWEETMQQNTPGTTDERPNWRRKARHRIEEIVQLREVRRFLAEIRRMRSEARQSCTVKRDSLATEKQVN